MAFKIRPEDFANGEKFVEVIPADYGKCVCLKVNADNCYELFKYQSVPNSIIAKALAYHLAKDNVAINRVKIGTSYYDVPEGRDYAVMRESLKMFLEQIDLPKEEA